jgi:hypothetical protein
MALKFGNHCRIGAQNPESLNGEKFMTVTATADGFTIKSSPHGEQLAFRFDDITKIVVRTTSDGPFSEDIFYEVVTPGGTIVVPSQEEGMKTLVDEHLLKLPGFDYETFIKAMGSTDDQAFVCFERE